MEVTFNQYLRLLDIYNSKKGEFTKKEFCKIIGISNTNFKSYNSIIINLIPNEIVRVRDYLHNEKHIIINRKKLETFIRKTEYFKKTDLFIHKSTWFADTGK